MKKIIKCYIISVLFLFTWAATAVTPKVKAHDLKFPKSWFEAILAKNFLVYKDKVNANKVSFVNLTNSGKSMYVTFDKAVAKFKFSRNLDYLEFVFVDSTAISYNIKNRKFYSNRLESKNFYLDTKFCSFIVNPAGSLAVSALSNKNLLLIDPNNITNIKFDTSLLGCSEQSIRSIRFINNEVLRICFSNGVEINRFVSLKSHQNNQHKPSTLQSIMSLSPLSPNLTSTLAKPKPRLLAPSPVRSRYTGPSSFSATNYVAQPQLSKVSQMGVQRNVIATSRFAQKLPKNTSPLTAHQPQSYLAPHLMSNVVKKTTKREERKLVCESVSLNGKYSAKQFSDNTLAIHFLQENKASFTLKNVDNCKFLSCSKGTYLIIMLQNKKIMLYDFFSKKDMACMICVDSAQKSSCKRYIALKLRDLALHIFDLQTRKKVELPQQLHKAKFISAFFIKDAHSSESTYVVVKLQDGCMYAYNMNNKILYKLHGGYHIDNRYWLYGIIENDLEIKGFLLCDKVEQRIVQLVPGPCSEAHCFYRFSSKDYVIILEDGTCKLLDAKENKIKNVLRYVMSPCKNFIGVMLEGDVVLLVDIKKQRQTMLRNNTKSFSFIYNNNELFFMYTNKNNAFIFLDLMRMLQYQVETYSQDENKKYSVFKCKDGMLFLLENSRIIKKFKHVDKFHIEKKYDKVLLHFSYKGGGKTAFDIIREKLICSGKTVYGVDVFKQDLAYVAVGKTENNKSKIEIYKLPEHEKIVEITLEKPLLFGFDNRYDSRVLRIQDKSNATVVQKFSLPALKPVEPVEPNMNNFNSNNTIVIDYKKISQEFSYGFQRDPNCKDNILVAFGDRDIIKKIKLDFFEQNVLKRCDEDKKEEGKSRRKRKRDLCDRGVYNFDSDYDDSQDNFGIDYEAPTRKKRRFS